MPRRWPSLASQEKQFYLLKTANDMFSRTGNQQAKSTGDPAVKGM